jgi:hypothetical protein
MPSWNIPQLTNKIIDDIPALKAVITALFRLTDKDESGTPIGDTSLPNGAKRIETTYSGSAVKGQQIQAYNTETSTWSSVGKLDHSVEQVDGYDASASVAANTIPVRDADSDLTGNLKGNAASATKLYTARHISVSGAATGQTQTAFDGTGNANIALSSLDVSKASGTAGVDVLAKDYGGTGNGSGWASDVILEDYSTQATTVTADQVGQIGGCAAKNAVDCDTLTMAGNYLCTGCTTALHYPSTADHVVGVKDADGSWIIQMAWQADGTAVFRRQSSDGGSSWSGWVLESKNVPAAVHIYAASDGSDAHTGLSADDPVLTVARALEIAKGIRSTTGNICLHFGPGEWGTVYIDLGAYNCHGIIITNYPNSQKTTVADFNTLTDASSTGNQPPHFDAITFYGGFSCLGNISSDTISLYNTYHTTANAISFCRCIVLKSWAQISAHTVRAKSGLTDYVFWIEQSFLYIPNTANSFANNPTNAGFICNDIGSLIKIDSSATWTGTFAGKKFYSNVLMKTVGMLPTAYPGSVAGSGSWTSNGITVLEGNNNMLKLKSTAVTLGTPPSSGTLWSYIEFVDKSYTRLGWIGHRQVSTGDVLMQMTARKKDNSAEHSIGVGYDANGNWYTYATTPANNDHSTKIATTAYISNCVIPTGSVMLFRHKDGNLSTPSAPTGWKLATYGPAEHDGVVRIVDPNQSFTLQHGLVSFSNCLASRSYATDSKTTGLTVNNGTGGGTVGDKTLSVAMLAKHHHKLYNKKGAAGSTSHTYYSLSSASGKYDLADANSGDTGSTSAHNHSFTGSSHGHGVTDPGHTHSVNLKVRFSIVIACEKL